jgi:isopentenyldiphosphate isomerase
MEFFDVLDCTGRKTGEQIGRDEAHRSGTWHGAFHCLIVYQREGRSYALFQKRSGSKQIAPGKFDVSVGGHYAFGEDATVAGPREIAEELGLDVRFSELLPLGRRVFVYCFTQGVKEYEFQDVFLLPRQVQPEKIRLQQEEVDGLLEMEVEAGIELFSNRKHQIECSYRMGDAVLKPTLVSADQFVPCIDNYYCKLLLLARRYFAGERSNLFI